MEPHGQLSLSCLLGGFGLLLSGCYVTAQALHQNDLFNTRRPVDDVLVDPTTAAATKTQLRQVQRVLAYAEIQGLKTHGAYRYVIQNQIPEAPGDAASTVVSYIVQAAQPDRLAFVTWWFPFVGEVPYLGYFRQSERDAKAAELRAKGYDLHLSGAGAFSSLGWFDDPIFSSMLDRNEADMAHLFFHELTHRTLWINGSTEFNENLAEYVAMDLTQKYLEDSGHNELIARYLQKRDDRLLFRDWLNALKAALTQLYGVSPPPPADALKRRKIELFAAYQQAPLKPKFKLVDYVAGEDWNNASVLGAALYAPDVDRFARARGCVGPASTVKEFLAALRAASRAVPEPFAALDSICVTPKANFSR